MATGTFKIKRETFGRKAAPKHYCVQCGNTLMLSHGTKDEPICDPCYRDILAGRYVAS